MKHSASEFVRMHDISLKGGRPERNCGIGCAVLAVTGMGDELFVGGQWTSFGAMAGALALALGARHYERRYERAQQQLPILQAAAMTEITMVYQAPCAPSPEISGEWLFDGESPSEDLE
jgi:hypothetical protein